MAFWGVEVKSGKSYTHSSKKIAGRLRLSQATLGFGEATKKSVVQCNVGSKRPVLLCILTPNQRESCHLDLEFEEADDVVFSVIGPRSVFLAGYYVQQMARRNLQSDTESYGEDIESTQSEESNRCTDDDNYEDSFIDDEELGASTPSPSPISHIKENAKVGEKNNHGKRRADKYKIFDTDSDSSSSGHVKTKVAQVENALTEDADCLISAKNKKHKYSEDVKISEVENEKDPSVDDKENLVDDTDPDKSKRSKRRRKELQLDRNTENENAKARSETTKENDVPGERPPSSLSADAMQPQIKTKKLKKKKSQAVASSSEALLCSSDNLQNSPLRSNDQIADADPTRRTLSNGLIIEDISFGPPDGKVAAAGKTVKLYYSATSKETSRILYSNAGETACKLFLGVHENLGWKCGIIGMRVGDKRRIIVPPSMRFVENLSWEENVPPNSSLVFEVELVGVRKLK